MLSIYKYSGETAGYYVQESFCVHASPDEVSIFITRPVLYKDNVCIEDPETREEMDICKLKAISDTLTFLVGKKLIFMSRMDIKKISVPFPPELQLNEEVINFVFDKHAKCLYYHVKRGILRKCFQLRRDIKKPHVLIIEDRRIMGLYLDPYDYYLYYFTKHKVTLVHLKTLAKRTVYTSEDIIYFLKLDFELQKTRAIQIIALSPTGLERFTLPIPSWVDELYNDELFIDIACEDGHYDYTYETEEIEKVQIIVHHSQENRYWICDTSIYIRSCFS
ncbi:hypothetical protein RF11_08927 [Thelohanellus kitauei]|uniref:Uncharacterized protein n=1 Tax=Thelohanellus kitauei TaxID=669202 RepID=A0A0C2IBP6_THEKT|nr:hypothetical protein RF11_08927 [Thelohanellus kitauei]